MAAMPQDDAQPFYTPARVRQLLRDYPEMGYTRPPQDDERVRVMVSRTASGASWEEPVVRAADIEQAVRWLNERDWRAAYVVRAVYCVGLTERDAHSYLSRVGVDVHPSTVHRWKQDGLTLLCAFLNGRIPRQIDGHAENMS